MIDKKALNLEMLRIAGFTCTGGIWTYPDGVDVDNGVPFFPGSLDECIKWIVPKLGDVHISMGFRHDFGYDESECWVELGIRTSRDCSCDRCRTKYDAEAKTPALAFCLAARKLK